MLLVTLKCGWCGKQFATLNRSRKYHSVHCNNLAKAARWKAKKVRAGLCQTCGKLPIYRGKRCFRHYNAALQDNSARYYLNKVE